MLTQRKRLSPEESRDTALEAARDILIADGPGAVTLKAVSARIGRTHANLLHHFGSAAGLQTALVARMAEDATATILQAVLRHRDTDRDPREVVDLTFDAFSKGGTGALATWMIVHGNHEVLRPIAEAIRRLVDVIARDHPHEEQALQEETLQLVLMAMGDALLGAPLAEALGLPRTAARDIAARAIASAQLHPAG